MGNMLDEATVGNREKTTSEECFKFFILEWQTLSLAGKGCSLEFWIRFVRLA